jgi:hypothetical protein
MRTKARPARPVHGPTTPLPSLQALPSQLRAMPDCTSPELHPVVGQNIGRHAGRRSPVIFAEAVQVAAATAVELAESLVQLQQSWRTRAGMPRRHSSPEALIKLLPAYPIVTLATATQLLGRSKQAANEAIAALARAEVLSPTTQARRNRAWEARELFELVNATERELATPKRGTASSRPPPRTARRNAPVD